MLLVERFTAGRSQNSLVKGLARQGADISPATLAGTCAQAGALLAPVAEAVTERSRGSWHLHADETTWRVFAPRDGSGPAKWWLWVFLGLDTVCFVMDPTRSGAVLARHAGIDEDTGQLTADQDGGPRRLVISSDFYSVYQSAGMRLQPPQRQVIVEVRVEVMADVEGGVPPLQTQAVSLRCDTRIVVATESGNVIHGMRPGVV